MQSVRVNVAVLSVTASARGNLALENIVADRLAVAGHQIASFEAVRDSETAIRSQLVGWLADPDVDLVLVIGDGEHTSAALKPMVDQALPGFADLLRMLAYQEIGASAMLSTAEAARCGTTFVFVIPGSEKAVTEAMDKLVLPQLDPKTKPRNLIASMPRLRDAVDHDMTKVDAGKLGPEQELHVGDVTRTDFAKIESARVASAAPEAQSTSVPVPIKREKTESGAGMAPKLPAGTAPAVALAANSRPRPRTGVHVIVRKVDDPTKPIEIEKLEQQLALSKEEEATRAALHGTADAAASDTRVTKPIDAPVATTAPATRANVATRPLDVGNLRAPGLPLGVAKPLPSVVAKSKTPAPVVDEASFADVGAAPTAKAAATATEPSTRATPKPQTWPKRTRPTDVGDATKPLDLGRLPKLPPGAALAEGDGDNPGQLLSLTTKETAAAHGAEAATPTAGTPASTSSSATDTAVASTSTSAAAPGDASTAVTSTASAAATTEPRPAARMRQPTPPPPLPGYVVPRKRKTDDVETLDIEPDAEPASTTGVVEEDSDPEVASSSFLVAPAPTKRRPTQPPPTISELVNVSPSGSLSELPQGAFNYSKKRPSKVPLVLLLLVLSAGIGGGAMYLLNREKEPAVAQPSSVPIDAAEPAVVATTEPDAAAVEPEIDIETPAVDAGVEDRSGTTRPRPGTTRPRPGTTRPATTASEPPPEKAPEKPAITAEPGCEEVACVLEKYARPCCVRFKPLGETFQPASGENLSKSQIKSGVDKMRSRVIACSEQHKDVKGTVKLSMTVDAEGSVSELSVQSSPDAGLGECVASALRKARFAKTTNGGSFTYPFVF